MSKQIPYFTKFTPFEYFFINRDQYGNEEFMDNSQGGWLLKTDAERLFKILNEYLTKYSDDDILKMRENHKMIIAEHIEKLNNHLTKNKIEDTNFVYILLGKYQRSYGYKIGRTKRLFKRMSDFMTKSPINLTLYAYKQTNDSIKLEKELHTYFKDKRGVGEWFIMSRKELHKCPILKDFTVVERSLI